MYKTTGCSAVIVAAGSGRRMGAAVPKQFLELCGKTVIERTAAVFGGCSAVDEIAIVTSPDSIEKCRRLLSDIKKPVKYVLGGAERYDSVFQGLKAVDKSCGIVVIHDGARPFVSEEIILKSIEAAAEYGACAVGVPSKDTIKIADENGFIADTPPRDRVYNIQTPQSFRREIIMESYEKAYESGIFSTDDAALAENAGWKVKIIEGDYKNIKLTTPDDMILGEKILMEGEEYKNG